MQNYFSGFITYQKKLVQKANNLDNYNEFLQNCYVNIDKHIHFFILCSFGTTRLSLAFILKEIGASETRHYNYLFTYDIVYQYI